MGNVLVPWVKHLGANVIGTVGSPAKEEIATALGCDHVINYATEDFAQRCRDLTDNEGVHVVYESIGTTTLAKSLDSLRPLAAPCSSHGPPSCITLRHAMRWSEARRRCSAC